MAKVGIPIGDSIKRPSPGMKHVDGCQNCPMAQYGFDEDSYHCGLDYKLRIYEVGNGDRSPVAAVPSECSLWGGSVVIKLSQLN